MASRLYDSFNRPGNQFAGLGVSDSGHAWEFIGTGYQGFPIHISENRARLGFGQVIGSVLDAGLAGQDGVLTCRFVGPGAGLGLMLRATGWSDHLRAYQRLFSYQYQASTETYVSHYEQVLSHYEQSISHYETVYVGDQQVYIGDEYSAFMTYREVRTSDGSLVGPSQPGYVQPYNERKYNFAPAYSYPPSYLWGDIPVTGGFVMRAFNYVADPVKPIYQTQPVYEQRPVYVQTPVYVSQPVYATRPVMATATGYELVVERLSGVAGVGNAILGKRQIPGPATGLRVVMNGSKIDAYAVTAQPSEPVSVVEPQMALITRHGITVGPTEGFNPDVNFIDDFAFNPLVTGVNQPHVLL